MGHPEQNTAKPERVGPSDIADFGRLAIGPVGSDGQQPTYTRLGDRELLRGLDFYRKRAYEKRTATTQSVVLQFHPNYRKLFENYRAAYQVLPAGLIGSAIAVDEQNLLLEIEHLGDQLDTSRESLSKAMSVLGEVSSYGRRPMPLRLPRYLPDLRARDAGEFAPFNSFVDASTVRMPVLDGGYGIEDPVASNFTIKNGEVFLVDMDNFGDDYNGDALAGFLLADVSHTQEVFDVSPEQAIADADSLKGRPVDALPFLCGYMGKVAVTVIDTPDPMSPVRQGAIAQLNQYAAYAQQLLPS